MARLETTTDELKDLKARMSAYESSEMQEDFDELNKLDEKIAALSAFLRLMEDEASRIRELLAAAEKSRTETKIQKIIEILANQFPNRPVLLFTEYKATQSLMLSSLMQKFGDRCVTFINGDDRADDVVDSVGRVTKRVNRLPESLTPVRCNTWSRQRQVVKV